MRRFLTFLILCLLPVAAIAQSSVYSTTQTNNTTSTVTTPGGTTTTTTTGTTSVNGTGGSIYTTRRGTIAYDNRIGSGYAPGVNNPYLARDSSTDAIADVDTPRKGFDDPRDPWDGRYTNDNPSNYSSGADQRAARVAAREAFVNRTSPAPTARNYTRGGVTYGPVHRNR